MALYVYITESCKQAALRHSLQDELERFRDRIEAVQDVRLFDPFPPPYLVKKKFGSRQGRLVASMKLDVRGHSVVVFHAVMIRGDAAYEDHFSKDPLAYGKRNFDPQFSDVDLEGFVAQRTAVAPPPEKQQPTTTEYGYLHQVFGAKGDSDGEQVVCESIDWVNRIGEAPFKNRLESIFQILTQIDGDEIPGGRESSTPTSVGVSVVSRSFPEHNIRLLVSPKNGGPGADELKLSDAARDVLAAERPGREMILQASRRAYPNLLLADLDLWSELQRDRHANLALSPEETDVLNAARRTEGGFPLFINGRAGSGKTTLLQYLFAEFMFFHLSSDERAVSPVYFTCNSELLSQSRRMVEKLLRCNAQWWDRDNRAELVENFSDQLDGAFKEFHVHLYSLLAPGEQAERFTRGKYVSFSSFKRLWHTRFGREPAALREHGPDISWHVIRSYIKGLTPEELTDPEEYQQLDQKQITVTQRTFEVVFNKVWTRWYQPKCDDELYWDDQDLARYLISENRIRPMYSAVFCDEAQDFTRVELELLLRSSVYSERKIEPTDIARVPFVFAGDQFQTLNPTGFRWDSIRASFVEKFILSLDPGRRSRLSDLNFRELTLNYRSSRTIVRFSNFVQALRVRLFGLTGVRPQLPWDREKTAAPVIGVPREKADFWERLKRERDIAIIVPCGDGEELEYIAKDPVLSSKIRVEDKVPDALVLSSSRAKGLEFNRVVVYGFGEADEAKGGLLEPLRGKGSYADDPDKSLPYQYFINRLYVAVSRPKRRLFIVDSADAFKNFWTFANDEGFESAIVAGIKEGEQLWRSAIGRLESGAVDDLSADRTEDPKQHADALARQGRANGDPLMLRYAAASYRNLNDLMEADRCKAEALVLEQNFLEAARVFLFCKLVDDAVSAFWRAGRDGGWKEILATAEQHPGVNTKLEFAFSQLIAGPGGIDQAIKAFARLAEAVATPERLPQIAGVSAWVNGVRAALEKLHAIKAEEVEWGQLGGLLEKVSRATTLVSPAAQAWVQFRAGAMSKAAVLWEKCKDTTGRDYKTAKAYSTPFPDKLAPMVELEKFAEAVRECAENPTVQIPAGLAPFAVRAHVQLGLLKEALHYSRHGKSIELVWQVIGATNEKSEVRERAFGVLFAIAAEHSDSNLFSSYAERTHFGAFRPNANLQKWIEGQRPFLDEAWMRGVARNRAIAELTWDDRKGKINQRPMAEFLKKTFFPSGRPTLSANRLEELGAATELLGNRSEALFFYEWARSQESGEPLTPRRAAERWIACKERRARWEEGRGDDRQARLHRAEANEARIALGGEAITAAFPEYPDCGSIDALIDEYLSGPITSRSPFTSQSTPAPVVPASSEPARQTPAPLAPAVQPPPATPRIPAKTEFVLDGLKVEYFRGPAKLVLRSETDGATASFRVGVKSAQGIDVEVVERPVGSGHWVVDAWSAEIDLTGARGPSVRFRNSAMNVQFEAESHAGDLTAPSS